MSLQTVISLVAAAIFGIACISTDAFAFRGGARSGRVGAAGMHAGVYHGGAYRGSYGRRGWGVGAAVGAAAVGEPWQPRTTTAPNADIPLTRPVIKLDSFAPLPKSSAPSAP